MYLTKSVRDSLEKLIARFFCELTQVYHGVKGIPKIEIDSSKGEIESYIKDELVMEMGRKLLEDGMLVIEETTDNKRDMVVFRAELRVLKPEFFGERIKRIAGHGEKPDTSRPEPAPRPQKRYIERR